MAHTRAHQETQARRTVEGWSWGGGVSGAPRPARYPGARRARGRPAAYLRPA